MITWENYEEYIMMHIDGELMPGDEDALQKFIFEHPELKNELAAYEAAQLSPDEMQIYRGKQSLLKTPPIKRAIAFPHWQRYGIAAGIAALVFVSLFEWNRTSNSNEIVAVRHIDNSLSANTASPVIPQPATSSTQQNKNTLSNQIDTNPKNNIGTHKQNTVAKGSYVQVATHKHPNANGYLVVQNNDLQNNRTVSMNEIPMAVVKRLPIDKPAGQDASSIPMIASQSKLPDNVLVSNTKPRKRAFIERLPLDETNKQQLKTITNVAAGTIEHVNDIKESIFNQGLSIQFNKKTVVLTF